MYVGNTDDAQMSKVHSYYGMRAALYVVSYYL